MVSNLCRIKISLSLLKYTNLTIEFNADSKTGAREPTIY